MEFYSHPDKKLIVHLQEVFNINKDKVEDKFLKAYEIMAYGHDFGKFTTYFQKYLLGGKRNRFSDHSFISALFVGFCAIKEFGENNSIPLIIFNTVLHHHGNLENPSNDLPSSFKEITPNDYLILEKIEIVRKQIEDLSINRDDIGKVYRILGYEDCFKEFLHVNIEELMKKIKRIEVLTERNNKTDENYFIHQILYSALISADKLSASGTLIPEEKYVTYVDLNREREEKIKGKSGEINRIRREIFESIQENIQRSYDKTRLFTITAPTGTGKTYAGFFAALKLKELLNDNRKIIYSLPFTSIIEQNYDVIKDLFANIEDFESEKGRYLIKHHSLANMDYNTDKYDIDKLRAELLIENWNSGIVITTFVQFLETLIGTRNRMLKKLISMKGSIILLDEVQAIDISLLPLVDHVIKKASELFDLRIIMMTATKPFILNGAVELLAAHQKYFKFFNRTKIIPILEKKNILDFIEEFNNNIENKSYLIVCNTINESIKIFNGLKNIGRDIFYLSTNLLPVHRRKRIEEVKAALDQGKKIILVSTQVVEAGVDFDFDVVIRDIGPIDSIIQCSGRCNRNGLKDIGEVYIYSLYDDEKEAEETLYAKNVYGNSTLNIVKQILQNQAEIYEEDYFKLIEQYYTKIQEKKNKDKSEKLINSIISMNFSGDKSANEEKDRIPLQKFSLIENNAGYFDGFIIYDQTAKKVFDRYLEMIKEKNFYKSREIYLEIKNTLRDYTVSLPVKYQGIFNEQFGLHVLPYEGVEDYYNMITGFIREEKGYDIL
ncbi:CRISPR-associated helicase/endonuclease Cas3 [Tepidibacillus sp. HK-1]|uniref:CRISPR-associated helicase/endonuclease Cas3 n=1 Tax=Tepidibacillus sp. HK-1 TaxID=1883407 RepID=UPI000852D9A1|nr:CRISPR-associated helicase/endonuclease Cas3 [Tepidibacillus sp. HK-1]GBF10030.1 CRISPR-associated nuclease/helicase Cas3 [Tepidibacillus sp. HK-1]